MSNVETNTQNNSFLVFYYILSMGLDGGVKVILFRQFSVILQV